MKVNITRGNFKDIPYLEYRPVEAKRLLFIQHGIYGNKEKVMQLLGLKYAKMGYLVVGIDAYKHGEREASPFSLKDEAQATLETFDVVERTVRDIMLLFHQRYKTFERLSIMGISMGGLMAYYLATQTKHVDHLIALISSPSFSESFQTMMKAFKDEYKVEYAKVLDKVKAIDPALHTERLTFQEALLLCTKDDPTIPYSQTENFVKNNPSLPITFRLFEGKHAIVKPMQTFIEEALKIKD